MTDSGFTKLEPDSLTVTSSQAPPSLRYHQYTGNRHHGGNVTRLLAWREVSSAGRQLSRKFSGGSASVGLPGLQHDASYIKQALKDWLEADSLKNCTAKYCPLQPAPRSTIATAFSSDGTILASTHGDHTVKIICCKTGLCLRTLWGHRRTPWVVSFHPTCSDVLASGSLDDEVKIWNTNTGECIASHDFHRPIASIAFHAQGHLLAVASGHKLYIWKYSSQEEDRASATIVLRTRRSLRNVHFHPQAVPLLLTAEVNGLDAPDCPMTLATAPGYLRCTRPAISFPPPQQPFSDSQQLGNLSVSNPESSLAAPVLLGVNLPLRVPEGQADATNAWPRSGVFSNSNVQNLVGERISPLVRSPFQVGELPGWELQFLQGWVMDQTYGEHVQATLHSPQDGILVVPSIPFEAREARPPQHHQISDGTALASISNLASARNSMRTGTFRGSYAQGAGQRGHEMTVSAEGRSVGVGTLQGFASREPHVGMIVGEISPQMSMATALAAAELPCTVKLRLWPYDVKQPGSALDPETCRLMIPHVVLCSEMGADFSPCGRFLAACVACVLPIVDSDASISLRPPLSDITASVDTSPTRHPMCAQPIIYELRVYSLEAATFGQVLASRAIKAAHCLTSIQFSPASNHILLAYGRRHSSLLRSFVVNGTTTVPIYTILEI
eukprot:c24019_g2_i1 orf=561-2570(+)